MPSAFYSQTMTSPAVLRPCGNITNESRMPRTDTRTPVASGSSGGKPVLFGNHIADAAIVPLPKVDRLNATEQEPSPTRIAPGCAPSFRQQNLHLKPLSAA